MNGALEFVSLAKKGCLGFAKVFAVNWPLRAHGIVDIGRIHFHFHCHFDLSCRSTLVLHFSLSISSCIHFYHSHSFTSHFQFSFIFHCLLRFYLDKNIKSHFENVPSTLLFHLKPMTPDQHIIVSLDCCFQYFQNFSAYLCFFFVIRHPLTFPRFFLFSLLLPFSEISQRVSNRVGDAVQRVWIVAVESLTEEKVKQLPAPHYISGKEIYIGCYKNFKRCPAHSLTVSH